MQSIKIFQSALIIFMLAAVVFASQSCSKNNNPKPSTQGKYYLNADMSGVSWQTNDVEAVDSAHAEIGIAGIRILGQDTSELLIVVNNQIAWKNPIPINNASSFADSTVTAVILYKGNIRDTSTFYGTPFTQGAAGSITISQLDTVNHVITGTFNTTVTAENNKTVTINGKFNARVATSFSQLRNNLLSDFRF